MVFRHWVVSFLTTAALIAVIATAAAAHTIKPLMPESNLGIGLTITNNTPSYVGRAKNLGSADPSSVIDVSLWLKLRNRPGLDQLARSLYMRSSPNYRHWLKPALIAARYGPTESEAQLAERFFESHNLHVVWIGPNNYFVRARGTVASVEQAFHITLNNYQVSGQALRANSRDPYVDGPVAQFVSAVSGLDSGAYQHPYLSRASLRGSSAAMGSFGTALGMGTPDFFTSDCFSGTTTQNFSSTGGTYPKATYSGNYYFAGGPNSPGCGYTPGEIAKAYHLDKLYAEGYNGAGQTINIIDWCGSLTIQRDANAFAKRFGLPLLTSSNFAYIQVPYPSKCAAPDVEISIDVEWAHAIAPGANINLVVPPSASFQDINQATFYIINYGLGNVISGSYGSPESLVPLSLLDVNSLISEIGAVSGVSTNYATGDSGDFTADGIPPTVTTPADSPFATGVGGVSLALHSDDSIAWQSGWGNFLTTLDLQGTIFDPPCTLCGFYAGAGGGPSAVFAKPPYQFGVGVPGSFRQLPDISWLADPYTGAVISISEPQQFPPLLWLAIGGTSVSCPMFSGLWAIANQEAGASGPLGQAAPYVYRLPSGAIYDIVPFGSKTNVVATIYDSKTVVHKYNASQVMGVGGPFYSALWNVPFYTDLVNAISFGTDQGLSTGVGWDNVTGVGTPNAKAFADAFHP